MSITKDYARTSFPGICLFAFLLLFFVSISGIAQATIIYMPDFGSNNGFVQSSVKSDNELFSNTTFTKDIFGFTPESFLADSYNSVGNALTSNSPQFSISARNKSSWHISERNVCVPDLVISTHKEVLAGWAMKYASTKMLLQAGL